MKLYHGTNGKWVQNIIRQGLVPRGTIRSRNNWKHVPHQSNAKCVYLTDSYAPYFAFNAARGKDPMCAVVEIETDFLNRNNLFPDEDFLEQSSRRIPDPIPGTMSERTLYYRSRQFEYDYSCVNPETGMETTWWETSLKYLGTCAHRGILSAEAITRIVMWSHRENIKLMFVWDPTISLMNQKIVGDRYRILTRKLFDGEFTELEYIQEIDPMERFNNPVLPPIHGYQLIDLSKRT